MKNFILSLIFGTVLVTVTGCASEQPSTTTTTEETTVTHPVSTTTTTVEKQ